MRLLVFLDDLLQFRGHRRNRDAGDLHRSIRSRTNDEVERAERLFLLRVILPKMPAAALLALERRAGDGLGYDEKVREILRRMPAGVVLTVASHPDLVRPAFQRIELLEGAPHRLIVADDTDEILHHDLKVLLDLERVLPSRASFERRERACDGR